jgi:hypothetical protein
MDYGGVDRRKTKGDLKRKRKNRVYKKGGQFRSHDIKEEGGEKKDKMGKKIKTKKRLAKK